MEITFTEAVVRDFNLFEKEHGTLNETLKSLKRSMLELGLSIDKMYSVAEKVLPKGNEDTPDTFEWFDAQFMLGYKDFLEEKFIKHFHKWTDYVAQKAKEYIEQEKERLAEQERYIEFQKTVLDALQKGA